LAQIDKLVQPESTSRASRLWLDQQVTPIGHMATVQTNVHTTVVSACDSMQTWSQADKQMQSTATVDEPDSRREF